jgi:hypothetical protein
MIIFLCIILEIIFDYWNDFQNEIKIQNEESFSETKQEKFK